MGTVVEDHNCAIIQTPSEGHEAQTESCSRLVFPLFPIKRTMTERQLAYIPEDDGFESRQRYQIFSIVVLLNYTGTVPQTRSRPLLFTFVC
jgi:hypothetical protein